MSDENCVFCKIVKGEIPSFKIWENDKFIAILDINPNCKGQTLIITKEHYESDITKMNDMMYSEMFLAAKEVSNILKKALNVRRVGIIYEGLGINHAHLKLYPIHGLKKDFEEIVNKEKVWFDEYPGYLTTKLGLQADFKELEKLAEEIRKYSG